MSVALELPPNKRLEPERQRGRNGTFFVSAARLRRDSLGGGAPLTTHVAGDGWEQVWRSRNRFRAALYSLLALALIAAALALALPSTRYLWGVVLALIVTLFLLAVVGECRLTSWPCPRCGKRFYSRLPSLLGGEWLRNAVECANCGLPWGQARTDPRAPRLTSARSRRGV